MNRQLVVLSFLLATFSCIGLADVAVDIAPLPGWVEPVTLEPFSADRSSAFQYGLAFHLSDRQVRKTSDGYEFAYRIVYEVIDRSGLEEAARITHIFDPSNETASFNFVRVVRNDEEFDRLADADITLLRQEEEMDSGLLDGEITSLIQLQDIRVGDVIDYSVSGKVTEPLWPEDFFDWFYVEWPVPIAQLHFSLLVPDELAVSSSSISTDVEPLVTRRNGWTAFNIHVFDPDPVYQEQNLPRDWTPYGFVAFTTLQSWSDIVDWALPLYSVDGELPQDFRKKLDRIAANHPDARDRTIHVLRLVQEDIRYLGIEIALGSHVPRPPAVTLQRGYGDCKDKSVLLVAALRYLGIDATPALASLGFGGLLPKLPPSIGNFDHVIVGLDIDGQVVWVDPTLSHQGGLADNLTNLDYGYVLPIRDDQEELVELERPVPELPTYEVSETFELPETGDVGLTLTIEYIYRDSSANFTRMRMADQGLDEVSREFLNHYAANYPGIVESEGFSANDELDENTIVYRASYTMDTETFRDNDYQDKLPVFATAVQDEIPRHVEANRSAPLRIPYGSHYRHVIRVSPLTDFRLPDDTSETVSGIVYSRRFENIGEAIALDFSLVVSGEIVAPESVKAVLDLGNKIAEDAELTVFLNSDATATRDDPDLGLPMDVATEAAFNAVSKQIEEENYVGALTGLNTLLARHADPTTVRGFLQHKRALVLVKLGRRKAALKAFAEAFDLWVPQEAESYFRYMDSLRKEDDNAGIVPVFVQLLEQQPAAADRLRMSWFSSWYRELWQADNKEDAETALLALARAVHEIEIDDEDQFQWVFRGAIEALVRRDDVDRATEYLQYLQHPDSFAAFLTSNAASEIWEAIETVTGANLSTAISNYVGYTYLRANLSPDDFEAHTNYMVALRISGRYQEALRYADLYKNNWPLIEAVGEDAFWFINETAYALYDAGERDEALQLMDKLLSLGLVENSSLISMGINRAELLMHSGQFAAALKAVEELEELDEDYASDYGRMWIYDVKACSLHQLGREPEASAVLRDSMTPIADENPGALTKTLLCLDDYDGAAATVIERLQEPEENASLIVSFSTMLESVATPPFLTELNRRAEKVQKRPDVRSAFDKVGRAISINGARAYWGVF